MSIRPPDLDSSTATMPSDWESPEVGSRNRVAGPLPALWGAPEDLRHEMCESLRKAEELLRPEHWGSGPLVTEDAAYEAELLACSLAVQSLIWRMAWFGVRGYV